MSCPRFPTSVRHLHPKPAAYETSIEDSVSGRDPFGNRVEFAIDNLHFGDFIDEVWLKDSKVDMFTRGTGIRVCGERWKITFVWGPCPSLKFLCPSSQPIPCLDPFPWTPSWDMVCIYSFVGTNKTLANDQYTSFVR